MTDEEKKAVEKLESYYLQNLRGKRREQQVFEDVFNLILKQQKELDKINKLNIPVDTLIAEFERLENLEDDREQMKQEIEELKEITNEYFSFKTKFLREDTPIVLAHPRYFDIGYFSEFPKQYIPKQKIKDKIKKIEQQGYWVDEDYYFNGEDEYPISQKNFTKEEQEENIISVLQELLKEE